ncbi:hypothetical protein FB451DRAFT_1210632 [Mycena latifolia]|nr:hypothetical protein FB451DRAFT_1210632 [Mycena latifolia]
MQHRAVSQITSVSRASIPIISAAPSAVVTPASVSPALTTAQPPPTPPLSTVVVTSILASIPPTIVSTPTPILPTAVYTTVTQVLTTIPTSSPEPFTAPQGTTSGTLTSNIQVGATTTAGYSSSRSSSFSRSSAARASASNSLESPRPHTGKPKSNVGKYVGYAIGAVFFLTLMSSFFSAYRKHRKYVRRRPRGSIFIGARLSDGQISPQKRSMAQALMRSVSNRSFDAYALSNTPPTSPAPVFQSHPELHGARGISPSPIPIRPLPPTPSPKYTINEEDAVFYPQMPPVDPREYSPYSPFGASSSGSSTQTRDPR